MKINPVGFNKNIKISRLGFGTWGLGSDSYGKISEKKSIGLLDFAFSLGINFFDTSSLYGNGLSEKRLGKFLKKQKNSKSIFISTKAGLLPHKPFQMKRNFKKSFIKNSLEKSLKNLNKEIDIFFLHSPNIEDVIDNDELIYFLEDIKKKGYIKSFGISADSPLHIDKFIDFYKFEMIQSNFNLLDQRLIDLNLLKKFKKNKISLIARTPFGFGFIGDKMLKRSDLDKKNDHRIHWSQKQWQKWNQGKFDFIHYKNKYKSSFSELALNFCLSSDFVGSVIPGMMSYEDIIKNVIAENENNISKRDLMSIYKIYKNNEYFLKK